MTVLLAHEYVHHIQKLKGFFFERRFSLLGATEGHARGVERLWAQQKTRSGQGPAFEYHQLSLRLPELRRAYEALCDHFRTVPKKALQGDTRAPHGQSAEMDPRGYGYVMFRVCELSLGSGIYRDLIRGELAIGR